MTLAPETIESYFERYGWSFTRTGEATWVTGVRTAVTTFRIFVRLTEHWVFFVINPYVVGPRDFDDRLRIYYNALRLNLDMNLVKFGLDADGDLFLATELPVEGFAYSHFVDALNALSHHAERYYSDIFNLAHNSDLLDGPYDHELEADLIAFDGGDEDDISFDEDDEPVDDLSFTDEESSVDAESLRQLMDEMELREDNLHLPRPLDDIDLPVESEESDHRAIIAGREVRIVNDENGPRVEFPKTEEPPASTSKPTAGEASNVNDTPSPDENPPRAEGKSSAPRGDEEAGVDRTEHNTRPNTDATNNDHDTNPED